MLLKIMPVQKSDSGYCAAELSDKSHNFTGPETLKNKGSSRELPSEQVAASAVSLPGWAYGSGLPGFRAYGV